MMALAAIASMFSPGWNKVLDPLTGYTGETNAELDVEYVKIKLRISRKSSLDRRAIVSYIENRYAPKYVRLTCLLSPIPDSLPIAIKKVLSKNRRILHSFKWCVEDGERCVKVVFNELTNPDRVDHFETILDSIEKQRAMCKT